VEIRPPKYGSERVVYLADGLVGILSAHVAAHCGGTGAGRFVFGFGADVPPHQNTVGHWWRKTRTAAGCAAVKLHDLRHFYASGLIAEGCDVVTVQRALGHASATVTLNTYSHLWPTAEDRTRAAAASMLAETLTAADSVRTAGQV
jgi:integrase